MRQLNPHLSSATPTVENAQEEAHQPWSRTLPTSLHLRRASNERGKREGSYLNLMGNMRRDCNGSYREYARVLQIIVN